MVGISIQRDLFSALSFFDLDPNWSAVCLLALMLTPFVSKREPQPGELVFARLGGSNPKATLAVWPAVVEHELPSSSANGRHKKATVYFFGDHKRSTLALGRLYPWEANKDAEIVKTRTDSLDLMAKAMHEASAFARCAAEPFASCVGAAAKTSPSPQLLRTSGETAPSETTKDTAPSASFNADPPKLITRAHACSGLVGFARGSCMQAGDMVFANLSSARANTLLIWPAIVLGKGADEGGSDDDCSRVGGGGSSNPTCIKIEFFGDEKEATLPISKLYPYDANRESPLVMRRREATARFATAMSLAELEFASRKLLLLAAPCYASLPAAPISRAQADGGTTAAAAAAVPAIPTGAIKRRRLWRIARLSNFCEEADDVEDEPLTDKAFSRRHAPFEMLEKAGFSSNPFHNVLLNERMPEEPEEEDGGETDRDELVQQ